MDRDEALRNYLIALLDGGQAHLRYDDVIADWPREPRGVRPEGAAYEPFQWGSGQTLLREAMLVADHNAYHLGELMALKKRLVK
jgi:hypothetical protein